MPRPWLPLVLLLAACGAVARPGKDGELDSGMPSSPADSSPRDTALEDTASTPPDSDGDGTPDDEDCAPADPAIHPGAEDACDEVDNDCDGEVDEDAPSWHADADADGYGDAHSGIAACDQPPGLLADGSDCDDADPAVHPAAEEVCDDGIDNDCDGGGCRYPALARPDEVGTWVEDQVPAGHGDGWMPWAVRVAGDCDIDGDGAGDLLVGVPARWRQGPNYLTYGEFYVLRGGALPPDSFEDAPVSLTPADPGGYFSFYLDCMGDVDGDGVDEIAVAYVPEGAPDNTLSTLVLSGLVAGSQTEPPPPIATVSYPDGTGSNGALGTGADLDGDAVPDLVVESAGDDAGTDSHAFVFPGTTTGEVHSVDAPGSVSAASGELIVAGLAGADTDGDGIANLVLGIRGSVDESERVYVFSSPFVGALTAAEAEVQIGDAGDPECSKVADWRLATPGDANGDGLDDLVVSNGSGNVYVVPSVPGASGDLPELAQAVYTPDAMFSDPSYSAVENAGDLDESGTSAIVLSAIALPDESAGIPEGGAAATIVVYAPFTGTSGIGDVAHAIVDRDQYELCGTNVGSVTALGDFDGDAVDDFAVACTGGTDNTGPEARFVNGGLWLIPGLGL